MIHLTLTTILHEALAEGWTEAAPGCEDFTPIMEVLARPHDWPVTGPYRLSDAQILDGRGEVCVRLRRVPGPCPMW